ncbi:unnamed protein product [Soboliphyme baturini]|uniref:Cyclin_C_2 domain-containing protein n=1 Tax=Soboliphyme baturini TaxID=241478 RepID=A0A183IQ34_9BILA|nr:unnamed protein product [Soboliphyme baturini]
MFSSQEQLQKLRTEVHEKMVAKISRETSVGSLSLKTFVNPQLLSCILSIDEERLLTRLIEEMAQRFCLSFVPTMPPSVALSHIFDISIYVSVRTYFRMACLYVASKVDEFNVSLDDFVKNLKTGTRAHNAEIILSLEPDLLNHLKYHLAVYTPYRPLEGHFIAMKVFAPSLNPENLRTTCENFLWKSLLSDVSFLFAPSQVC